MQVTIYYCNCNYYIILYYIQVIKTSQLPSLEVYFWYHHQNFYKTFSDNNILKEEPYFCAWTRSPQKCFRSEYSKKNKNPNKKKKKKIQQQTNYQRKQCSAYLHPTEINALCRKWMRRRWRGSPGLYGKRLRCSKLAWACTETKANSDIAFYQFLSLTARSSQLQE